MRYWRSLSLLLTDPGWSVGAAGWLFTFWLGMLELTWRTEHLIVLHWQLTTSTQNSKKPSQSLTARRTCLSVSYKKSISYFQLAVSGDKLVPSMDWGQTMRKTKQNNWPNLRRQLYRCKKGGRLYEKKLLEKLESLFVGWSFSSFPAIHDLIIDIMLCLWHQEILSRMCQKSLEMISRMSFIIYFVTNLFFPLQKSV